MSHKQYKIEYLRIVLTGRCNLNCFYCHNEGTKRDDNDLNIGEIIEYSKILCDVGIQKIKLMGGEPTLRNDCADIIKGIRKYAKFADISMITNGLLIKNQSTKYMDAGLNRINISVHDWEGKHNDQSDEKTIKYVETLKKNIKWMNKEKYLSKINFVILKGVNENKAINLIQWCSKHNITLDLLNLLSSADNYQQTKHLHYNFNEILNLIDSNFQILNLVPFYNKYSFPSTRITLENGGQINLKTTSLNKQYIFKSCRNCSEFKHCLEGIKAIRLTNQGIIKPCLLRNDNTFNLRSKHSKLSISKVTDALYQYIANL